MAKRIHEGTGLHLEIQGRGKGSFQVILYGNNINLVYGGTFKECVAYLWGVRDMWTAS